VWALAGCVYLVAALIAIVMTRRIRAEAELRLAEEGLLAATGVERLEVLLAEIDHTHRSERERPKRQLPYIPRRRRAGSG
jgi:hypothetical protein